MMHEMDIKDGPANLFPDGRIKYDENGRRVGATALHRAMAGRQAGGG